MRGYLKPPYQQMDDPVLWEPSLEFCAQSAHFFSGWAVVLTASQWLGPWWAAVGFLAYGAVKEGVVDPVMEGDDVWPDGCKDFGWYAVGVGIGVIFALWR